MLGHIFPWESLWYSFYRRMSGPQDQSGHEGVKKNVHPFDTWDRTRAVQPVAKHLAVWATWPIVAWRYNTVNIETMKLLNICCTNSIKEIEHYLQYIDVCKAFYIGETRRSLSLTAWMDTVSPLQFWTQTYQLLSILNPIRFYFKIAGLLAPYTNYLIPPLTTFATSLKSHTNLSSNHVTPQA